MTTPDPTILFVPSLSQSPGQTEKQTPQGIAKSCLSPVPPPFGGTDRNEPSDQSFHQLVPEHGTNTPCGHTNGTWHCTLQLPHEAGRHWFEQGPRAADDHMVVRAGVGTP